MAQVRIPLHRRDLCFLGAIENAGELDHQHRDRPRSGDERDHEGLHRDVAGDHRREAGVEPGAEQRLESLDHQIRCVGREKGVVGVGRKRGLADRADRRRRHRQIVERCTRRCAAALAAVDEPEQLLDAAVVVAHEYLELVRIEVASGFAPRLQHRHRLREVHIFRCGGVVTRAARAERGRTAVQCRSVDRFRRLAVEVGFCGQAVSRAVFDEAVDRTGLRALPQRGVVARRRRLQGGAVENVVVFPALAGHGDAVDDLRRRAIDAGTFCACALIGGRCRDHRQHQGRGRCDPVGRRRRADRLGLERGAGVGPVVAGQRLEVGFLEGQGDCPVARPRVDRIAGGRPRSHVGPEAVDTPRTSQLTDTPTGICLRVEASEAAVGWPGADRANPGVARALAHRVRHLVAVDLVRRAGVGRLETSDHIRGADHRGVAVALAGAWLLLEEVEGFLAVFAAASWSLRVHVHRLAGTSPVRSQRADLCRQRARRGCRRGHVELDFLPAFASAVGTVRVELELHLRVSAGRLAQRLRIHVVQAVAIGLTFGVPLAFDAAVPVLGHHGQRFRARVAGPCTGVDPARRKRERRRRDEFGVGGTGRVGACDVAEDGARIVGRESAGQRRIGVGDVLLRPGLHGERRCGTGRIVGAGGAQRLLYRCLCRQVRAAEVRLLRRCRVVVRIRRFGGAVFDRGHRRAFARVAKRLTIGKVRRWVGPAVEAAQQQSARNEKPPRVHLRASNLAR